MKRDGSEVRQSSGEETPSKKRKVFFTDEKTVRGDESVPIYANASKRSTPSSCSYFIFIEVTIRASRPGEAFGLLEEGVL